MRNVQMMVLLLALAGCSEKPLTPDELRAALRPSAGLAVVDIKTTSYGLLTKVRCVEGLNQYWNPDREFDYRIWTSDYRQAEAAGDVGGFMNLSNGQMQTMCSCLRAKQDGDVAMSAVLQPDCDALMAQQKSRVDKAHPPR